MLSVRLGPLLLCATFNAILRFVPQCTFALVSRNGLDFSEPSGAHMRQPLAGPGLHVFRGHTWPTLHGVSEGGVLWHAHEPAQADVTAWEADYRFTGVLRQYVQNVHGPSAEVAAVTAAIVRNGLLEVRLMEKKSIC